LQDAKVTELPRVAYILSNKQERQEKADFGEDYE